MLSLEETIQSQEDLDFLCSDRPLNTNEIFKGNAFYGIDNVIKEYAGFPKEYQLKVVIPHGIYLNKNRVWDSERNACLPIIFCYPAFRKQIYEIMTDKKVILSASPYIYTIELLKHKRKPKRRGLIFFPHHSTHHISVKMDYLNLAEELCRLDDKFKPITICIFWRDYNLGHHKAFEKKGLRIVTAGHMFDPLFLFRLHHLCSIHQYASGNGLGSHIFYSIKSGCSYFHFTRIKYKFNASDEIIKRDTSILTEAEENEIITIFSEPKERPSDEQLNFVNDHLGDQYQKTKDELHALLKFAEILDKTRFLNIRKQTIRRVFLPTYFYRQFLKLYKAIYPRKFRKIV